MIFCYNKAHVGDCLMVIAAPSEPHQVAIEQSGNVTQITRLKDNQVVGWNIFNVSSLLGKIDQQGQVQLTDQQLAKLNDHLSSLGFEASLVADDEDKFVVGYVKECQAHPDSDHLHMTQIEVDQQQTLQIVCGAPNIAAGQKVVVAKPGAMMPDGLVIWPGSLRGIESCGMICSAKELGIGDQNQPKGILVLDDEAQVGAKYSF